MEGVRLATEADLPRLAELAREISSLVRQEAALAKAEMSQKAARVGRDVGFLAAGGASSLRLGRVAEWQTHRI